MATPSQDEPAARIDPVVAAYLDGVDRSLIDRNLRLSVEERFLQLMELQRFAWELKRAAGARRTRSSRSSR